MNLYADFAGRVRAIVAEVGIVDAEVAAAAAIVVEPPRDPAHGDMATNAALVLAKAAGRKPREIAEIVAERLRAEVEVAAVEIAGPGFLNIRLADTAWPRLLAEILSEAGDYGRSRLGGGAPVNVEYVSANPTGPMHVGHCRGAVFGDALASLLAFAGYEVTREYYINDAGAQVDVLARSAFHRYREALGDDLGPVPDGLYPGDYLVPVGVALAERYGSGLKGMAEAEWLPIVRDAAIDAMMAMIRDDLALLNVRHDVFFSERSLTRNGSDRVREAIADLSSRGLIYQGRLEPPKGQLPDDWEDREQTLFRATEFGDDVDRALMKSDGSYTYFANDIAYHYDKFMRGFDRMIDVWGADHGGYVKRMQAAVSAISGGRATLEVRLCQLVRLFRAGEPVKMSKRAGTFVTLGEVVEEVGPDAVRFMMLFRKNDAPLDFDFALVTEKSRENPVFYVQYAHARCASIFRQAEDEIGAVPQDPAVLATQPLDLLTDAGERALVAKMLEWPRVVEGAALAAEPHRIAFFLHELAALLHGHWNRGKELPDLRFINAAIRELTMARLALVRAVQIVLATGLELLGVAAVDEMR